MCESPLVTAEVVGSEPLLTVVVGLIALMGVGAGVLELWVVCSLSVTTDGGADDVPVLGFAKEMNVLHTSFKTVAVCSVPITITLAPPARSRLTSGA
jgi:hypothetical protein